MPDKRRCFLFPSTGEESNKFVVDVLHNPALQWHTTFSIVLGPDEPAEAMFGEVTVATITILDNNAATMLVLPAPPRVSCSTLRFPQWMCISRTQCYCVYMYINVNYNGTLFGFKFPIQCECNLFSNYF